MAVMSYTVQQVSRYIPVADELETMLKIIQNDWGCKVISVSETTVNKTPDCSSQAFIIIYDDTQKDVQRGKWHECYTDSHHYSGICSVCGKSSIKNLNEKPYDYCPRCGADMREKEGE